MLETLLTAEEIFLLWIQDSVRNDVLVALTVCACLRRWKGSEQ